MKIKDTLWIAMVAVTLTLVYSLEVRQDSDAGRAGIHGSSPARIRHRQPGAQRLPPEEPARPAQDERLFRNV